MTSKEIAAIRFRFGSAFFDLQIDVAHYGEGSDQAVGSEQRFRAASREAAPLCEAIREGEMLDCVFAGVSRLNGELFVTRTLSDCEMSRRMPIAPPDFLGSAHISAVEAAEFPWLAEALEAGAV